MAKTNGNTSPSNKEIACDFILLLPRSKLDMSLGMDERKALKLMEEIGPDKFEYYVYGGRILSHY